WAGLGYSPARCFMSAASPPTAFNVAHNPFAPNVMSVWRSPLFAAALAWTAGMVCDRYLAIPLTVSFVAFLASLTAWGIVAWDRASGLPLVYLAISLAAIGAAYHRAWLEVFPADNIGTFATEDPRPGKIQGYLLDEPTMNLPVRGPLRTLARESSWRMVVEVDRIHT